MSVSAARNITTVRDFFRHLGGFLLRKCDSHPGWLTLCRGRDKLLLAISGFVAMNQRCGSVQALLPRPPRRYSGENGRTMLGRTMAERQLVREFASIVLPDQRPGARGRRQLEKDNDRFFAGRRVCPNDATALVTSTPSASRIRFARSTVTPYY